jgi:hypothetical protein
VSYYYRSLPPVAPVEPEGARPVYPEHRMDFLTIVLESGVPEYIGYEYYQGKSPAEREEARRANVKAGMTRYMIGVCADATDEIANPQAFVPILQELFNDGLGPCVAIAPEDSPLMQDKYLSNLDYYIATLQAAFTIWLPWTTEIWIGIEADEVFDNPDDILTIARGLKSFGKPIVVHLLSGNVLPRGTSDAQWWVKAKDAGVTHFAYQANHPPVEDGGRAFLADPDLIRGELRAALEMSQGAVSVISSEYAYFGINPTPQIVQQVSEAGYVLGEKSLEETGVVGISNGGPGYWPPEELVPVDARDEIDINQVRFYSTHPYSDISALIRSWPIESDLTPSFPRADKVSYQHSATLSWPVFENGCNANSWLIFNRGQGWEGYTNDYLRAGSCEKTWSHVNSFDDEPITWGPPASGEMLYLLVTKPDPRRNDYPVGYARSQLVKVYAP